MDFYKKIFRNKNLRFHILSAINVFPNKFLIKLEYRLKLHRKLDLESPKRYTEKLQWYKLYYRDPKMVTACDKNTVRDYVKQKGLGSILNEQYCVFDSIDEISFDDLPERFVLKLSNCSSTNLLFDKKDKYSLEYTKKKFREYLVQSRSNAGCEWVYSECKPVIVADRFLDDLSQPDGSVSDYKILCFNGKPEYIIMVSERYTNHNRSIYDTSWNNMRVDIGKSTCDVNYPKPENLDEMLETARILSEDFPAARVDLYSIGGKIYFGEITFFPWSGFMYFNPDSFDYTLGGKFVLPEKNYKG